MLVQGVRSVITISASMKRKHRSVPIKSLRLAASLDGSSSLLCCLAGISGSAPDMLSLDEWSGHGVGKMHRAYATTET